MSKIVRGIVHGHTIELAEDPGVVDGAEVEVVVKAAPQVRTWGEGIRRSAGGWADYPEMDAVMEQIQRDRRRQTLAARLTLSSSAPPAAPEAPVQRRNQSLRPQA